MSRYYERKNFTTLTNLSASVSYHKTDNVHIVNDQGSRVGDEQHYDPPAEQGVIVQLFTAPEQIDD